MYKSLYVYHFTLYSHCPCICSFIQKHVLSMGSYRHCPRFHGYHSKHRRCSSADTEGLQSSRRHRQAEREKRKEDEASKEKRIHHLSGGVQKGLMVFEN